jgi:hypothetical protein
MRLRGILAGLAGLSVVAALGLPAALADAGCANESLRQGPSANLPDCRAYEEVSPPYKQGGRVNLDAVSPDASRVLVNSAGNFGDAENSLNISGATYLLTRGTSGWTEKNLDPPAAQFPYDIFLDATPDLGKTLLELRGASQSVYNFDFWVRDADGTLHDIGPASPPAQTEGPSGLGLAEGAAGSIRYLGASSDLSKIVFTTGRSRWSGDTTETEDRSLYEYTAGQSGPPTLVGVDNGGHLIGECGVDGGPAYNSSRPPGIVSADGSRVFFTVENIGHFCSSSQPPADEIFARVDGSNTVAISKPSPNAECTTMACMSAPPGDAEYVAASQDGSRVFFTSTQQLTDGASEDSSEKDSASAYSPPFRTEGCSATTGPGGCNLYEYDFDNPAGHNLVLASGGDPNPRVQGVVAVSEDGSHAYFVAHGVLTHASNQFGSVATDGSENLYVFERDAQFPNGQISFIGVLSPEDLSDWRGQSQGTVATATPDGRFLVFPSVADLTPDDTSTAQQVFRYDAQTGELVRVSIGQEGFNANGNTNILPAEVPGAPLGAAERQPTAISDDGAYVVFRSADGLTPGALNAHETDTSGVLAQNVYEYHEGTVRLISDGLDANSVLQRSTVELYGMVGSGRDVFFQSADRLAPQDGDTDADLYDARIGGGFPAEQAAAGCVGDACQGSLAGVPVLPAAGSSSFSGSGNLSPGVVAPKKASVKPKKKSKRSKKSGHKAKKRRGKASRTRGRVR